MRKAISIVLIIASLFTITVTSTGCGNDADYAAPLKLYDAWNAGENVTGKTVEVIANRDYFDELIFNTPSPDLKWSISIYVSGDGADKIKDGDTVIVKITECEELLTNLVFHGTIVD